MSAEENMALAHRFIEARLKGDLDALDEMMAPDYISHTKLLPDEQPDREGTKRALARLSAAVSNVRVVVEDQAIAGDKVITRFTVHATHDRGTLFGVAPTGRQMTDMTVAIYRISGARSPKSGAWERSGQHSGNNAWSKRYASENA
jgi:predicted ester cyclase